MDKLLKIRVLLHKVPPGTSSVVEIEVVFKENLSSVRQALNDKYGKRGWCGFDVLECKDVEKTDVNSGYTQTFDAKDETD